MIILGIETSCDETSLSLIEVKDKKVEVLKHLIHSQIDLHKPFGGVFPMLAKREHEKILPELYKQIVEVLEKYNNENKQINKIDKIVVTIGPGLEPALWTGIVFAKELAQKLNVPIVGINHMEGHIYSALLDENSELREIQYPSLALLISGGHTELVLIKEKDTYQIIGKTVDDAIGEAYDKVARMIGIDYPGGPEIAKRAKIQREENIKPEITLPRPMIKSNDLNFSFAGLKTSVLYALKGQNSSEDSDFENKENKTSKQIIGLEKEFEEAVKDVIIEKTRKAVLEYNPKTLLVAGGVAANTYLRENLEKLAEEFSIEAHFPAKGTSGDNALMIALAGIEKVPVQDPEEIKAKGNLSL